MRGAKRGPAWGDRLNFSSRQYDADGESVRSAMSPQDNVIDGSLGTEENWRMMFAMTPGRLTKYGASLWRVNPT
jgi:hypothetical protein